MRHSRSKQALSLLTTFVLISGSLALPAVTAAAQATTGNIIGTVTDQSGAAIVAAKVIATNKATGQSHTFETTGEGGFRLANLAPGRYDVTVEAPGFKRTQITDVEVRIGTDNPLNPVLAAGQVDETITVVAGGEEVAQVTSQISSSFDTRRVEELPSNAAGGGIDTLALLAPGIVPGFGGNQNGVNLSVNGNRARSNNFTLDGTDNNDLSVTGPAFFVSNQDSVQEFQVITNNFSAQFGRNLGAIVNIVTKGGGNEFHGSAFEFHRNSSALDAMTNQERADAGRHQRDKFISNVFGGTFGGPIVRDRAFFFVDGQLIRQRQNFLFQAVNPAITREGLASLAAAFPNNPAVAALVNQNVFALQPSARPQANAARGTLCFPRDPSLPCAGENALVVPTAFPEYDLNLPFDQKEYGLRGDFNVTDRDSFNVKWRYQNSPEANFNSQANGFLGDIPFTSRNLNGQYTRQITSRMVNQFSAAFQKLAVNFAGCSLAGGDPLKGCIPDVGDVGAAFTNITFTGITVTGATLQALGPATNMPQGRDVRVIQLADTLQYTTGRHQLMMGVDFRDLNNQSTFLPNFNGAFRFNSTARIVQNFPNFVLIAAGEPVINYKERDQFYFFQDDFKVRDNLTLNLGVRYEYTGQPINTLHELTLARESDPATALWRQSIPLDQRVLARIEPDRNNWAPRLGFAYSPRWGKSGLSRFLVGANDATVIRGGFSIAYDPAFFNILTNIASSAPTVFLNTINNTGTVAAPGFRLPADPTGEVVRNALGSFIQRNTFDPRLFSQTVVSPDFHLPYSQQWSLGIQRQINRNNVFEVRYVGNRGVGLFQTVNRNPDIRRLFDGFSFRGFDFPDFRGLLPAGVTPLVCTDDPATADNEAACNGRILPGRGLIRSRENTASSSYHGMQTRYNGRLFNQLTLGAAYTWSKTLDNASEIFGFGENAIAANPFDLAHNERGLSGNDRPHVAAINFLWDIPYWKEQRGFVGRLLGGWQLNGVYNLASGRPFTPSQFTNLLGAPSYQDVTFAATFAALDSVRPFAANRNAPRNSVGISDIDASFFYSETFVPSPTGFYDLAALNNSCRPDGTGCNFVPVTPHDVRFILNGPGSAKLFNNPFGTVLRNSERGPALNQLNLGLFKNARISEGVRLQFRAELFNALNHPNPGVGVAVEDTLPPALLEEAGLSGNGTGFNDFRNMELSSRRVQFGVRIVF
jgi:outer membrane receptor protein involved in Fe transport